MTQPEPHILIVDDHREIRDVLSRYLRANGYRATTADSAAAARRVLKTNAIDLAVVDVMMPGEDGLALTRSLRTDGALPIILLTARGEEVDRIIGLEIGADDYLAKPCNPRELIARIAAVLRRARGQGYRSGEAASQRVRFDSWLLDIGRRELISANGTAMPLSAGEFRLLVAFIERPNVALTRDQLLDLTQGRSMEPFDRSIDSAVSRLRRKIETDTRNPRIIKTVWGGGYIFAAEPVAA
jgi:two-component system OmpR family response regulator